jgi:hypothetical protein
MKFRPPLFGGRVSRDGHAPPPCPSATPAHEGLSLAALVTPVTRNHRRLAPQGCSRWRPRRSQTCLARSERRSLMSGTAMGHAHGITVLSGCAVSRNGRRDDCNNGSLDGFSRGKSNLALVDNSRPCCETIASLPVALGSHAYAHSIQPYASRPASLFAHIRSSYGQDKPAMIIAVQVVVPQVFQ